MSHRILSKTTGFNKAVVVKGASLQTDANVIQYDYNRSANDEWLFIPVKTQVYLGTRYAKTCLTKPMQLILIWKMTVRILCHNACRPKGFRILASGIYTRNHTAVQTT